MAPLRKRLVTAHVRGKQMDNLTISCIGRDDSRWGVPLGDNAIERNRRDEGMIVEAQLQGDWGFDSRIVLTDNGSLCAKVFSVSLTIDASSGF